MSHCLTSLLKCPSTSLPIVSTYICTPQMLPTTFTPSNLCGSLLLMCSIQEQSLPITKVSGQLLSSQSSDPTTSVQLTVSSAWWNLSSLDALEFYKSNEQPWTISWAPSNHVHLSASFNTLFLEKHPGHGFEADSRMVQIP